MAGRPKKRKRGLKRVEFRPNRQQPGRRKRFVMPEHDDKTADLPSGESVRAKGDLSRKRTVLDRDVEPDDSLRLRGTAVSVLGQYVEVDDGTRIHLCTIRRILRTRLIEERSPVVVGDEVIFSPIRASIRAPSASEGEPARGDAPFEPSASKQASPAPDPQTSPVFEPPTRDRVGTREPAVGRSRTSGDSGDLVIEGVIQEVLPRSTVLKRSDGRRTHVIAANVEQAVIVSSVREPMIKPHLIDRYLVAAHAGGLRGIICINKVDLDEYDEAGEIAERYGRLGYQVLATSTQTGQGIEELKAALAGRVTIVSGQSGVGKSSLLNAVHPAWRLKTAEVSDATEKGRHTTTTSVWLKLNSGGAVVDTPGIRALDVAMVPLAELEMHFVEFDEVAKKCRFPNCAHIQETGCAVKTAVEAGEIDPSRYESYLQLFMELSEVQLRQRGILSD
jgi:ribosome biogenesis GTPase